MNLGSNVPQAYVFCTETAATPLIFCAHFPGKYMSALDGTASRWDDRSFAFVGDHVQGMITTIDFPNDAFHKETVFTRTIEFFLHHLEDLQPILP